MRTDALTTLTDHLATLAVTVVCHPEDADAVAAAVSEVDGCPPVKVHPDRFAAPGQLLVVPGAPRTIGRRA